MALSILTVLAVGGAVAGAKSGLGPTPCGSNTLAVEGGEAQFAATFLGDTMLGDAAAETLEAHGYDWAFANLQGVPGDGFAIANAEGPITTRIDQYDDQGWSYNANPPAAAALARSGIDALALANNHAMDRGPEGLADSLALADEAGMATVGAGPTLCEAELPLIVRSPAGALGIVALSMPYGRDRMAGVAHAGTVAMTRSSIRRGATLARAAGATWLVAFVHWGQNYRDVTEDQQELAAEFAASGYDLVVGAHPHLHQRVEVIDGMPVVYSLGNFAFGAPGRFSANTGYGLTARAIFDPASGLTSLEFGCIVTDNDLVAFQPRPCSPLEAQAVLPGLNAGITMVDGQGVLALT